MQESRESLEPVCSVLINAAALCRKCLSSWECQGLDGSIWKSRPKPPLPIRQGFEALPESPGTDNSSLVLSNPAGIPVSTNCCFPEDKCFLWNFCSSSCSFTSNTPRFQVCFQIPEIYLFLISIKNKEAAWVLLIFQTQGHRRDHMGDFG